MGRPMGAAIAQERAVRVIERLAQSLDPLHGLPEATRREFAHWYQQAKLPQIRYVAFLTMVLYLIYAAIEQNVARDHLGLRLLAHGVAVPLALLAVGLMSFRETARRQMLVLLCVAPVGAVVANLAFNYGKPDFAYFVPEIDATQAQAAARTLQERIRQFDFDTVVRKTASFGITQFHGDESPQHMLDRADRALYRAKAGGRDRIEVH